MAGSMKTNGTEELSAMLAQLEQEAPNIASKALYEGAGVVADAYAAAVAQIRTEPFRYATENNKRLASPAEKGALTKSTGVAKFNKNGSEVDTIVGAAEGYSTVAGKTKATKLLARSINSGTSFMVKQPVFRKASSGSRAAAQAKMVETADTLINEITK